MEITSNQVEPSREGRKRTREAEIIVHNVRENRVPLQICVGREIHLIDTLDTWL